MIAGIFHNGSGIGNQLHRYVTTRVLAKDKGFEHGMCFTGNFKASFFMNLDMGVPVGKLLYSFDEAKEINEHGQNVADYDWRIKDVKDFTLVDGNFEGEKYYEHRLDEIREWLKVEPLEMPDDVCVIGFRGGEYVGVKDLFLPKKYWEDAISMLPGKKFEVHTDDIKTAQEFFPEFPCIHDPALNWRAVRYAKHLIIANSSFFILPSLLGDAKEIIAPHYWAGYNKGYQQQKQAVFNRFTYI